MSYYYTDYQCKDYMRFDLNCFDKGFDCSIAVEAYYYNYFEDRDYKDNYFDMDCIVHYYNQEPFEVDKGYIGFVHFGNFEVLVACLKEF